MSKGSYGARSACVSRLNGQRMWMCIVYIVMYIRTWNVGQTSSVTLATGPSSRLPAGCAPPHCGRRVTRSRKYIYIIYQYTRVRGVQLEYSLLLYFIRVYGFTYAPRAHNLIMLVCAPYAQQHWLSITARDDTWLQHKSAAEWPRARGQCQRARVCVCTYVQTNMRDPFYFFRSNIVLFECTMRARSSIYGQRVIGK